MIFCLVRECVQGVKVWQVVGCVERKKVEKQEDGPEGKEQSQVTIFAASSWSRASSCF